MMFFLKDKFYFLPYTLDGTIDVYDDWLYDATNQTFYYKTTLAPHATTDDILNLTGAFGGIALESVTEGDQVKFTYHPVVTFIVEGVQANPNNAVTECWGVTLDSNGNITSP